jgi:hypothetical protein
MAIAKKNRRCIIVEGREFLWWIYEDLECGGVVTLSVASLDKRFFVRYAIDQPDEYRHLCVMGPEFPSLSREDGSWVHVRCPILTSAHAVTPKTSGA